MKHTYIFALILGTLFYITAQPFPSHAQDSGKPIVFSRAVITIVPGAAIPKIIDPANVNNTPDDTVEIENESEENVSQEENSNENSLLNEKIKAKIEVKVRQKQVPLDSGLFTKYQLDANHAVLTYYTENAPHPLKAENIYEPVDVLFIREDGVIIQAVPQIMLAYLPEEIETQTPIRATLYLQAGLSEVMDIVPGDRIEHGMFTPRPQINKVKEEE